MKNYTFKLVEYLFCWPYSILTKCHIQGHFLSLNVTFKQKHIHHGFDGHFGTFNYNVLLVWPHLLPQSPSSFYGSIIFFVPFHSISHDLHPSSSNKLCEAKMLNIKDRKPQIQLIHDSIIYMIGSRFIIPHPYLPPTPLEN